MNISSLSNATLSGSGTQYQLTIPNIGIAELLNVTASTEGSFKLQPKECNNEITSDDDSTRHHADWQRVYVAKRAEQQ